MSTNSTEPSTVADEIAAAPAGFREGICGNEAPSLRVGCTSMPVVCELSYGHRSEWHQGEGHHRWRPLPGVEAKREAVVEAARAYREARYTAGAGAASDALVAAVDALDGAS